MNDDFHNKVEYFKLKVKGKVVPVQAMKSYRGSSGTAPLIPNWYQRHSRINGLNSLTSTFIT